MGISVGITKAFILSQFEFISKSSRRFAEVLIFTFPVSQFLSNIFPKKRSATAGTPNFVKKFNENLLHFSLSAFNTEEGH